MTPAPIQSVMQKCVNEKCGKWFELKRAFVEKLEFDWRLGHSFNRVCLCSHCFAENLVLPVGQVDPVGTSQAKCKAQCIVLATLERVEEGKTKGVNRASLVERRNELMRDKDIKPPLYDANPTKKQLERAIHELETPAVAPAKPEVVIEPTSKLLARLNVLLKARHRPTLKAWKGSRAQLEQRVKDTEQDFSHITVTKAPPAIAKGAETARFDTSMHKNKLLPAAKRMSKERDKIVNGETSKKRSAGKAKPEGDFLTPADIASLVGKDPRAVRVVLRKLEKKIPKTCRVEGVRWGFKKECRDQIVKIVKGGLS